MGGKELLRTLKEGHRGQRPEAVVHGWSHPRTTLMLATPFSKGRQPRVLEPRCPQLCGHLSNVLALVLVLPCWGSTRCGASSPPADPQTFSRIHSSLPPSRAVLYGPLEGARGAKTAQHTINKGGVRASRLLPIPQKDPW